MTFPQHSSRIGRRRQIKTRRLYFSALGAFLLLTRMTRSLDRYICVSLKILQNNQLAIYCSCIRQLLCKLTDVSTPHIIKFVITTYASLIFY